MYLERGSIPRLDAAIRIADHLGVDVRWFAIEDAPEHLPVPIQSFRDGASIPPGMVLIPRLDIAAAAGAGVYVETEQTLEFIALPELWLRKRGISPWAARVLSIKGDSMEPTIRDGDIVIVDTSFDQVLDNAIYVLTVSNRLLVKRIHVLISGAMRLISDNPIYPQEDVPADGSEYLRVAGRVMWFGRSI